MFRATRIGVIALLVALGSPFHTTAQPSPAAEDARVPFLMVSVMPGFRVPTFEKSVGGEIPLTAEPAGSWPLSITSDVHGACSTGLSQPGNASHVDARGSAAWFIDASLVSLEGDQATIDVRWQRRVPRPGVLLETNLDSVRRLVLRDRAKGVLDLVRAAPGAAGVCDSLAIALELRFRSLRGGVADAGFGYDLWLVDRSPKDAASPVRTRIEAPQGNEAPYAMPRMTLTGRDGPARISVFGALIGEARSDGAVDLQVDSWLSARSGRGSSGNGGRKRLVVRPGETIEFQLPESMRTKLPPDLQHHDFALRVTTERLW